MKNKKIIKVILLTFCLIFISGSIFSAGAIIPYTTYTVDVFGDEQRSPHAYVPLLIIDSKSILDSYNNGASELTRQKYEIDDIGELNTPKDIVVDNLNHVYIADSGNNRIVGLDEEYNIRVILSEFINNQGIPDSLSGPSGVYVTDKEIFVADSDRSRIVIFDKTGEFVDIIPQPSSDVMPDGFIYKPIAIAVDRAGRVYVVSSTTNYGILSLNRDGSFNGFVAPQKVTYSVIEYFMRMFKTEEQKKQTIDNVSKEYNNLTIDQDGFIYATIASIEEENVQAAVAGKSKSGDYAPVKKLNPGGSDVMNRNGLFPPSGEVAALFARTREPLDVTGPSKLVDVALGPNKTWSIIDNKRSKVYTYDDDGNLLYAFGDKGDQMGNIQNLIGIAYQGSRILLLDSTSSSITVYKRTEYGDLIDAAIRNTNDKNYEKAVDYYLTILQRNNNYDSAYIGIGESLYRNGDYLAAMQYFRYAYDNENFYETYGLYRKEWVEKNVWVIPVVILLVILIINRFLKFVKKYNKKGQKTVEKRTFISEILYGFHIIFHPFDGFWDLKHEKRGSLRGAHFWFGLTILVFIYKAVSTWQIVAAGETSYFMSAISIGLPVILLVLANWSLTTLFDGEGTFKDIYVATCYSLIPLILFILPVIILSNFTTLEEMDILNMLYSIGFVWTGFLIFFGLMVTHDYTFGKNILTTAGTILGIAFIMFISVLFTVLLQKVFRFGYNIFVELKYRFWS